MATFVNDLRLTELATGEGSGTWGTTTNQSLELIGESLGYATQQAFSSDADATTTVADGVSDPARAMYFKVTSAGSLSATRTLTIAPNTISRVMFIENATSGSQSIAISQGSGANVTILTGKTAVVYLDGAGSGAAVVDAMAGVDPGVTDTLAEVLVAGNTSGGTNIELSTTDKVQFRDAAIYINSSVDGQLDIVADTEIQIAATTVDLNGNLDVSGTTVSAGKITADAGIDIDNINIDGTTIALSSGDLTLDVAGDIILDADGGDVNFKDAGTEYLRITNAVSGPEIFSPSSDGDLFFKGNDGGSTITALTLDMSNAGRAFFNVGASFSGDVAMGDNNKTKYGAGEDLILYSDGTNGEIEAPNGDLTLDVAGNIILDADGGEIEFKDGGTTFGNIAKSGNDLRINQGIQDGDIVFRGNDGGSIITALTLDMSAAGAATFNSTVNGMTIKASASGDRWGCIAEVASNGVMEVGRYIDFHATDGDTSDYGARLDFDGTNLVLAANVSATGTLDVASTVEFATTQGLSYAGTKAAGLEIGTAASGGSLLVRTPSLNSSFSSGLMVDGAYSSEMSQVNLTAAGVYSGGGYEGHLHLRTMSQTSIWPAITAKPNSLQFYTANTERMAIDSSGRVTMPYQPAFSVYKSAVQSNLATGYNTVTLDSEMYDIGGNFTSNTFTAPVTGKYMIVCNLSFMSIPLDAQWFFTSIDTSNRSYNNSTSLDQYDAVTDSSHVTTYSHTVIADMDVNDTMVIKVYQYTGTTSVDISNGSNYTYVQGILLS